MTNQFLMAAVVAGLIVLLVMRVASRKDSALRYGKREKLFTPAERSFLGALTMAVDGRALIFGKVCIDDVIEVREGLSRSEKIAAKNRIAHKHFDFVLCDKDDLTILCAIELNDRTHRETNRKARDSWVRSAAKEAGLKLFEIPAQEDYVVPKLRAMLAGVINAATIAKVSSNAVKKAIAEKPAPSLQKKHFCSKCSSLMIEKVANKGEFAGKRFLACTAFPKCHYIQAIPEKAKGVSGKSKTAAA